MNSRTSGFSLLEMTLSVVLGGLLIFAGISIYRFSIRASTQTETANRSDTQSASIAINLRNLVQGVGNFQGLAFSPDGTNLSWGPGFFVEPDVDVLGSTSSGNDRIYVVTKVPLGAEVRLNAPFGPGYTPVNSLALRTVGTAPPLDALFAIGDLLVLSDGQKSDLLSLGAMPLPAGAAAGTIAIDDASFSYAFAAPTTPKTFNRAYLTDDSVSKARILRIGLNPTSRTLLIYGESASPRTIADEVTRFSVSYLVKPGTTCGGTSIASVFARDDWTTLNTAQQNRCYRRIDQIRFDFTQAKQPGSLILNTLQ